MPALFAIFWSFFKIGAFTFGGGYAMIPLIQHEVIKHRGWIEERTFLDMLTLAQTAPGPISLNTAVFVGYKCRGVLGALIAVLGVVLPSFFIILLIAIFVIIALLAFPWIFASIAGLFAGLLMI